MIEARSLSVRNGDFVLEDISFHIEAGQYSVLMGRTGSGKTTLMEAICGLKTIVGGTLLVADRDVTHLPPAAREIGFVPQDGALFESLTVREHLEFALAIRRWRPIDMAMRVDELAELLQIEELLERRPRQLSGGERQRVALGRALSFRPTILCLDEPLSALDDVTRTDMMALLKQVQKQIGVTALHVTHNRSEADELADVRLDIAERALTVSTPRPKIIEAPSSSSVNASQE